MKPIPQFPIKVRYINEKEVLEYQNEMDLVSDLKFFDNEMINPDDLVLVTDAQGRPVILKIESLELIKFELK